MIRVFVDNCRARRGARSVRTCAKIGDMRRSRGWRSLERRAGALKPRAAVLRPAVVREDALLGPASQIEPYTYRIDRSRLVELARRRILAGRVSALYYRLYRLL